MTWGCATCRCRCLTLSLWCEYGARFAPLRYCIVYSSCLHNICTATASEIRGSSSSERATSTKTAAETRSSSKDGACDTMFRTGYHPHFLAHSPATACRLDCNMAYNRFTPSLPCHKVFFIDATGRKRHACLGTYARTCIVDARSSCTNAGSVALRFLHNARRPRTVVATRQHSVPTASCRRGCASCVSRLRRFATASMTPADPNSVMLLVNMAYVPRADSSA